MTDHERNSNTLKACRMSSTKQEKYEESKFSKITGRRGRGQNAANRKNKTDGKELKGQSAHSARFLHITPKIL